MMHRSKANARRKTPSAQSPLSPRSPRSRGAALAPILLVLIVAALLGIFFLLRSSPHASVANDPAPTKPQGTQTTHPPTTETWTLANGLPSQVMRLAFSAADPTRGYATAFVTKQTQAVYTTADSGTSWQHVATVQSFVGDYFSTDPRDSRDVVLLSAYAPVAGQYTFQRSLDGGRTWSAQTTDLPTTGMVARIGWAGSTFLVGFQLDGQLRGASAVVAFPKGQPSVHLDVNGKINGIAIPHLRLLTGQGQRIAIWGDDGAATPKTIGLATTDLGRSWAPLSSTILGGPMVPVAATDDGGTVVATSADGKKIAVSRDGGAAWAAQPAMTSARQPHQDIFITPKGKTIAISRDDGTYTARNGAWNRLTSKQIVYLSESDSQHTARLWTYDDHGLVIWCDA